MPTKFNAGPHSAEHLTHHAKKIEPFYPALDQVTRPTLTTREAAYYLNRAEQTLRMWAMDESGPICPIRIHGRLGWPVNVLKRLTGVAA